MTTGTRQDPFPAFRFEIKIGELSVGGFSECNGLTIETEIHEYQEGGLNTHSLKFPTRTKLTNLTLKRGIVDRELWDWYWDVVRGTVTFRNGSILVKSPDGQKTLMSWDFSRAYPCKWVGPELNATQSNVAVETFELVHHGLRRVE